MEKSLLGKIPKLLKKTISSSASLFYYLSSLKAHPQVWDN